MRDLLLWRLLDEPWPDVDALLPLLAEAAQRPLSERFVFFGSLERSLTHADPRLRAAATRCLAGASGEAAWRWIVDRLKDDDVDARLAAVAALRASAEIDPPRWAHALFHGRSDVRGAALREEPAGGYEWFLVHLAADPEHGAAALARLHESIVRGNRLPYFTLSTIEQLVRARALSPDDARRLIATMSKDEFIPWLAGAPGRSSTLAQSIITQISHCESIDDVADDGAQDPLDTLVMLFWDASEDDESDADDGAARSRAFFTEWRNALLAASEHSPRVRASILLAAFRLKRWCPQPAELCAVVDPWFLASPWIPRDVRRAAIRGLYDCGTQCPSQTPGVVRQLLDLDLVAGDAGSLDLWIVGGLLHLLEGSRYLTLINWFTVERLAEEFLKDPEGSAPFLSLPDTTEEGRQRLIREITRKRTARRPHVYALLIHAASADGITFLDDLEPEEAVRVVAKLLELESRGKRLSPTRTRVAAETLGGRIAAGTDATLTKLLVAWMSQERPQRLSIGIEVFGIATQRMDTRPVIAGLRGLDLPTLKKLLPVLAEPPGLPFGKELKLANEFLKSRDEELRAWAVERLPATKPGARAAPTRAATPGVAWITPDTGERIAGCDEARFASALTPCLEQPARGLCEALARRVDPTEPQVAVCIALLGCHDPLEEVDREFRRFSTPPTEKLRGQLDRDAVRVWQGVDALPLWGHAWLCRWERHAFALMRVAPAPTLDSIVQMAARLTSPLLQEALLEGVERIVGLWRFREKPRLVEAWSLDLARALAGLLDSPAGKPAARTLMHVVNAGIAKDDMLAVHSEVALRLPELSEPVREVLQTWIDTRGAGPPVAKRPVRQPAAADLRAEIATCHDLDRLEAWCAHENPTLVDDAALRLLDLGEPGAARLLNALRRQPPVACAATVAISVALWPAGPAREALRAFLDSEEHWLQLRFLAGIGLAQSGEPDLAETLIDLAGRPDEVSWFQREDWDALVRAGIEEHSLALRLAVSPHPRAYTLALSKLKQRPGDEEVLDAVEQFLEQGTTRIWTFRVEAAEWLHAHGRPAGFPVLLANAVSSAPVTMRQNPFASMPRLLVDAGVAAWLAAGRRAAGEDRLVELLRADTVNSMAADDGLAAILQHGTDDSTRPAVIAAIRPTRARAMKLRRIAENFAWGIRLGRELTQRLLQFEILAGEELGYTRLREDRIFVNILPVLRGERNGRDVVQALILHEIGHHVYHRGEEPERLWADAAQEGLGGLLNLVADEQLERSLRAVDQAFGDRLKRLAAYAFQHARKELLVYSLLHGLQGRAFDVLTHVTLGVARGEGCVRIESGELLVELERNGSSFARFVRALRMGLGNRHADEKVDRGLALFRGAFRRSQMPRMVEIARELREIFGSECSLLDHFGQDSVLAPDAAEVATGSEGITTQEINEEIQRISNPSRRGGSNAATEGGSSRWINVSGDGGFDKITTVVPVPYDPAQHKPLAQQAAGPARQLRRFLKDLGVNLVTTRMRLRGRVVDRSRLNALVLRNDPRLLIAREPRVHNDLFIAAVIDCSGSMSYGSPTSNMDKAKLFASVLAEACRGLPNVDLRLFGFTDSLIYDAGGAERPAVHGLDAGGGNNDAAGLWHAAQEALASPRKARVLVMISDGLPTECSVEALKGLVNRLSRRKKICCAQVAVQPLTEICFPHYVLLNEADPLESARNFGLLMARLVRRTLSGS